MRLEDQDKIKRALRHPVGASEEFSTKDCVETA